MFFTLPTLLTWTRIVAIPLIVGVFYLPLSAPTANLAATVMFMVFAWTDWLDGFLGEFSQVEGIRTALVLNCPAEAVIRFDPGHLHQVLWNLVRNGWRYCRKHDGSLSLIVTPSDGRWQLDVWNDGPAVPVAAQAQLFEPFFTTDARGTGLGLYIAREICQANAAQIEYLQPPQGGACFRITFGVTDGQKDS